MPENPAPGFHIGNVGAGAQVAQGSNITQTLSQAGVTPADLRSAFAEVFRAIDADSSMDEEEREVAREATEEVVKATERAAEDPSALKRALVKAQKLLGGAWGKLVDAMRSDAVQRTIATITEATVQAGIRSLIGP